MEYPKSKMAQKLKRDELVTCLKINVTNPIPVEIAALCGVDCAWLDMEYVGADLNEINQCILAAKDERILTAIRELSDYLCQMRHADGFWVKETIQGLGQEVALEEQEEKVPWIKLCQIGD